MARPVLKDIVEGNGGLDAKYIPDFDQLKTITELMRASGYTIVLTQGVYDMFHVGHARYLQKASMFGHILIVGLDSDELTRETKGHKDPTRPFDPFESRLELLGALWFVKVLTRRHTDRHTDDLIKLVQPDVLVISKTTTTFTEEKIKELAQFCPNTRIEHLEAQADPNLSSTTAKLRRLRREGAKELADKISSAVSRVLDEHLQGD